MTSYEQRQEKIEGIIRDKYGGVIARFAHAVEIAPSTVSRWFMKGKGHKNVGEDVARDIESKLKLPKYSLDGDDIAVITERRQQPSFGDDHFARKLSKIWDELPDDAKGQILAFAQVSAVTKAAPSKKA